MEGGETAEVFPEPFVAPVLPTLRADATEEGRRARQAYFSRVGSVPVSYDGEFAFASDLLLGANQYLILGVAVAPKVLNYGYIYRLGASFHVFGRQALEGLDPVVRPVVLRSREAPAGDFDELHDCELIEHVDGGAFRSTAEQEMDSRLWIFGAEIVGGVIRQPGEVANPTLLTDQANCDKNQLIT